MTKADFVAGIAKAGNTTKKQANGIFEAFVEMVAASLKTGDRVAVPGLGSFCVCERKARMGRNPRTGAEIKIPARKAVRFSASSTLSKGLNGAKKPQAKTPQKKAAKKK